MNQARTRRRLRLVTIAAALVGVVSSLVVVGGPAFADDCQTRTWSTSTRPAPNMIWMGDMEIHRWGHFVVSDCRASVTWEPEGLAYDSQADVWARIRVYNSRGNTAWTSDWVFASGRGPVVRLAGMVAGRTVSLEIRAAELSDRREAYHMLGKLRF